jgi:hypothetical protein
VKWARLTAALAARSLIHPSLGVDLLRVAWRLRRREWHRRPPFLPLPDAEYVRWRMYTAYGRGDVTPPATDIVRYARWAAHSDNREWRPSARTLSE